MPNRRTLKDKIQSSLRRPIITTSPLEAEQDQLKFLKSDLTRTIVVTIVAVILQLAMKFYLKGLKI